jgi:transcriptional regulator with XRE-family HTH domain
MSQERLGEALGLTFQQVQKYERGANRIGASRLYDLSRVLDVPVSFFFDDLAGEDGRDGRRVEPAAPPAGELRAASAESDPMARRETLDLVRAYYRIDDAGLRKRLFELTRAVAGAMPAMPSGDGASADHAREG